MSSLLSKYFIGSYIFTGVYKLYQTQNVKIKRDYTNETTRLLAGERIFIILYSLSIAQIATPYHIYNILNKIDNNFNNVMKTDDDKPKYITELLFF